MIEFWKDVKGYEGLYKVSNMGRVKSVERDIVCKNGVIRHKDEMILKPQMTYLFYHVVVLCKNGEQKTKLVHRLVAEAFIPNPNNYPEVNHKDADTINNFVCNLEWVTHQQNMAHMANLPWYKNHKYRQVGPILEKELEKLLNKKCN